LLKDVASEKLTSITEKKDTLNKSFGEALCALMSETGHTSKITPFLVIKSNIHSNVGSIFWIPHNDVLV